MTEDEDFMRIALAIGRRGQGLAAPNPAVGCVIVRDGIIVGRGYTQPGGRPHAETMALAQAGEAARGATAYVTLEPCSHVGRTGPCADALARAGISRVVGAIRDPDPRVGGGGFALLRNFGLLVTEGVLEAEARAAHVGHFSRISKGRPSVTLKLALSADGKVAGANGGPVRITGSDTNAFVHGLRSRHDAIAVGVGTVLADDPLLTVRLPGVPTNRLGRLVFDSALRLPLGSNLVATAGETSLTIVAAEDAPTEPEQRLNAAGVTVLRVARAASGLLDLGAALRLLGTLGLTRLFVEGGPGLAASLIEADLLDEAFLIDAPLQIGAPGLDGLTPLLRQTLDGRLPHRETMQIGADTVTFQRRS